MYATGNLIPSITTASINQTTPFKALKKERTFRYVLLTS
nr:MAG TPA: hypothetical protein [Bacteriophage sp.]